MHEYHRFLPETSNFFLFWITFIDRQVMMSNNVNRWRIPCFLTNETLNHWLTTSIIESIQAMYALHNDFICHIPTKIFRQWNPWKVRTIFSKNKFFMPGNGKRRPCYLISFGLSADFWIAFSSLRMSKTQVDFEIKPIR